MVKKGSIYSLFSYFFSAKASLGLAVKIFRCRFWGLGEQELSPSKHWIKSDKRTSKALKLAYNSMMTVHWLVLLVLWSMNDGSYSNATLSIWHMKLYDKAHVLKEFHAGMGENIAKSISRKLIIRVSNVQCHLQKKWCQYGVDINLNAYHERAI